MAARKKKATITGDVVLVIDAEDDDAVEAITELFTEAVGDNEITIRVAVAQPTDEEEGDDDEEGDDEEEGEGYSEDDLNAMSLADLKAVAEEMEIDVPKGKAKIVAAILEAQEGGEDDEEEEGDEDDLDALGEAADEEDEDAVARLTELAEENDLDPDEYATWAELAEALAEAAGDVEELDEDALNAMSLAELKKVATEQGVELTKGMKKAAIIEAILETAEEE